MRKCENQFEAHRRSKRKSKRNMRSYMSNDPHERQLSTFMLRDGVAIRWRCFVTFRLDNVCPECFIRCIGTATHVHNVSDNMDGLKNAPLNINFSLQNIFRAADSLFFFFFSLKFFGEICRVYMNEMCV